MTQIRKAKAEDARIIQSLAERIWWPTYSTILAKEQIRYMLDHIYDLELITAQIREQEQTYLVLRVEEEDLGFASYSLKEAPPAIYKLHKLYCLPETRGMGYGKLLLQAVEDKVRAEGVNTLDLNVNKYNPAKTFYEKMGFGIIDELDIPIGPYWMNDFVMRKQL